MKKRMFSILWWWSLTITALCIVKFDMLDALPDAKSSTTNRNDKLKLLSGDENNVYGKGDKSIHASVGDNAGISKGGGDIIPIPDHLLNTDYEHHYSYEEETADDYSDYDDEYHHSSGKHKFLLFLCFVQFYLVCFISRSKYYNDQKMI